MSSTLILPCRCIRRFHLALGNAWRGCYDVFVVCKKNPVVLIITNHLLVFHYHRYDGPSALPSWDIHTGKPRRPTRGEGVFALPPREVLQVNTPLPHEVLVGIFPYYPLVITPPS